MIDSKPTADYLDRLYEREFVDGTIEGLIVAQRAYEAAHKSHDKSQIEKAETERYCILMQLSDFVAGADWLAP